MPVEVVLVVVLVAVGTVAVVALFRSMSGSAVVRRQFDRHPLSTIADATVGPTVRLSGTVTAADEPRVSEASGRPFVARDLRIVVRVDDGAPTRPAQESIDVLVDDGTGVALLRGIDTVVAIERDFEAPETTLDREPWADRLLRAGGYHNGSPSTCRLQIYEGVISPGDRVEVVGRIEAVDPDTRRRGVTVAVRPVGRTPVVMRRVDNNRG